MFLYWPSLGQELELFRPAKCRPRIGFRLLNLDQVLDLDFQVLDKTCTRHTNVKRDMIIVLNHYSNLDLQLDLPRIEVELAIGLGNFF